MRNISFRGKRRSTGEWVYGDLSIYADDCVYISCQNNGGYGYFEEPRYNTYEVIPKTVGQFTGKNDKNGKWIFEGDVVRYINNDGTPAFYNVIWDETMGAWRFKYLGGAGSFPMMEFCNLVEIICNIHDNPELLKESV